eukprot:1363765-Ditylum_brightwellii.AAC.1
MGMLGPTKKNKKEKQSTASMKSQPAGAVRHLWSNSTKPAPVSSTTPTTKLPAKPAASKKKRKLLRNPQNQPPPLLR